MKLWSDTQMFFVVDTEFCQNEADDPQDAIIYFSPQDTPDTTKCTLCCHIMGICRFMKLGFSPVSLIRLIKGKFAIRTLGKYLLALRGGPDMPDSILQRQINSMIDIFLLLYNGFDAVENNCDSRDCFLYKMADVWSFLLPISQHHGDNLSLTFNIIPSLDLPKTAGLLFLQASQFLQACQRFPGVYAGTLFCDQKVLCTQLPVSILRKLAFVHEKQRSAGKTAPVSFDLPGSVKLLFIYLSLQDVHRLNVAHIGFSRQGSIDPDEEPGLGPSSGATLLKNEDSGSSGQKPPKNVLSPKGDFPFHQSESSDLDPKREFPLRQSETRESDPKGDFPVQQSETSEWDPNVDFPLHQPEIRESDLQGDFPLQQSESRESEPKEDSTLHQSATKDLPLDQSETGSDPNGDPTIDAPQSGECLEDCMSSYNSCTYPESQVEIHVPPNTPSYAQNTLNASYTSSDVTLTQDTVDASSSAVDDSFVSKQTSSLSSNAGFSLKKGCLLSSEPSNYQQFVLYVQGYNDTMLCLVLDDGCEVDPLTIHGLWKLGMNTLMSLETDVKSCLEMSPGKEQDEKADSAYLYLQYDRKLNKARGDLKVSRGSSIERQIFNRSAQLLHEDFSRERQLYEATVCARDLVVYGHKLGARETYFHSRESSPSDRSVGFPLQSEQMCTIATKARKRLEKERRLLLL